jgi:hypothetical protein
MIQVILRVDKCSCVNYSILWMRLVDDFAQDKLGGRRWWSSSMVLLGFGKLGDDGDTLQLLACKLNGLESRLFVLELGVLRN